MIKIIEMRTALLTLLKTIHSVVFFHVAPDNAVMPYIVYDLPNSVDSGVLENFVLDVDFWDNKADTTALETLANSVDVALHKKTIFLDDKMSITLYRQNRLTLADDDPRISRRKYIYQARTYIKYY